MAQASGVELAEVVRAAEDAQQLGFGDFVLLGRDRDDLLRRNIDASRRYFHFVEMPAANRAHRSAAFEQVVGRHREEAAFGRSAETVPRSANALDGGRDGFGRIELADELDGADVDAEFERRGRYYRLQLAALEALLCEQPLGAREATMMRHDSVGAEPLLQVDRDALCRSPAQRKNQRRAMLTDEARDFVVHRVPMLMRRQRPELGSGREDLQVHRAHAIVGANYFDRARRARVVASNVISREEAGQLFDRIQRRRQTDSIGPRLSAARHQSLEALERERQMRAALVAGERMEFVDDDVADGGEFFAELRRGQQDEQGFGRRHENMRRPPEHRSALAGGGISGAQAGADSRKIEARLGADVAHAVQRLLEIEADVVGQRLQRRNVKHRYFVAEIVARRIEHQAVDRPHEGCERLAAAGRRAQQNVEAFGVSGADYRPSEVLRARRRSEAPLEPGADRGMEVVERSAHCKNISPARDVEKTLRRMRNQDFLPKNISRWIARLLYVTIFAHERNRSVKYSIRGDGRQMLEVGNLLRQ